MIRNYDWIWIVVGSILIVALAAVLGGTILYWIWPIAIPASFPALVEQGYFAYELLWWQAVTLVWSFGILFKSTNINTK